MNPILVLLIETKGNDFRTSKLMDNKPVERKIKWKSQSFKNK